jgi:hypothetical protein
MSIEKPTFPGRVLACPIMHAHKFQEISGCEVIQKIECSPNEVFIKFDHLLEAIKWANLIPGNRFVCYKEFLDIISFRNDFNPRTIRSRLLNFGIVLVSSEVLCEPNGAFDLDKIGNVVYKSAIFCSTERNQFKQIVEFENIDDAICLVSERKALEIQFYIPSNEEKQDLFLKSEATITHISADDIQSQYYDINLQRVELGLDPRTTCMIRNIPNKYSQTMLIDWLNVTHSGTYDFLYLRMDFRNRCNVGYAFINFIETRSIPSFVTRIQGKKWDRFNSDKICKVTYARIQGKLSLISKFKRSR